jgi:hypothetical protein
MSIILYLNYVKLLENMYCCLNKLKIKFIYKLSQNWQIKSIKFIKFYLNFLLINTSFENKILYLYSNYLNLILIKYNLSFLSSLYNHLIYQILISLHFYNYFRIIKFNIKLFKNYHQTNKFHRKGIHVLSKIM